MNYLMIEVALYENKQRNRVNIFVATADDSDTMYKIIK